MGPRQTQHAIGLMMAIACVWVSACSGDENSPSPTCGQGTVLVGGQCVDVDSGSTGGKGGAAGHDASDVGAAGTAGTSGDGGTAGTAGTAGEAGSAGVAGFDASAGTAGSAGSEAGASGSPDASLDVEEAGVDAETEDGPEDVAAETGPESGFDAAVWCWQTSDCDDLIDCTHDSCLNNYCYRWPRAVGTPNACPAGKNCVVGQGCVDAPACQTVDDCNALWGSQPCKMNIQCDGATSTCLFDQRDIDGDGFPPLSCGGSDCNDNDADMHADNVEKCDKKDQNCDGMLEAYAGEEQCDNSLVCNHHVCE